MSRQRLQHKKSEIPHYAIASFGMTNNKLLNKFKTEHRYRPHHHS